MRKRPLRLPFTFRSRSWAVGLLVGVVVSLFQAVTQIHEMTLTFVPKIIAVLLSLLFLLPWMMQKMVFFTEQLIRQLPQYIH